VVFCCVPGSVLGDEEVEEGEGHRVTGEHVVATRPHSLGIEGYNIKRQYGESTTPRIV
jgi:hypothetical protein